MSGPIPLDRETLRQHRLPGVENGGKETKGRLLVLAGSRQVPGAAMLAATAAMRSGAGKLQIATVDSIAPNLAIAMPEAMVVPLAEADDGGFAASAADEIGALAKDSDCVVAGPGVTDNDSGQRISGLLLECAPKLALDAGLLRCVEPMDIPDRETLPVFLPHAGELADILDCDEEGINEDPAGRGLEAARRFRALVLVKGVVSHVVHPDGRIWRHEGGSPGLGVSGSGDTLAGIVGGLMARGADPLAALLWGVRLHGEAGAALEHRIGPVGFLAREICDEIPTLLTR